MKIQVIKIFKKIGYFYNKELNMYYDGNSGYFFNPIKQSWCYYDNEKNQFKDVTQNNEENNEDKKEEKKEEKKKKGISGKFVPNPKFEQAIENIEYTQNKKNLKNNVKNVVATKVTVKRKKDGEEYEEEVQPLKKEKKLDESNIGHKLLTKMVFYYF
jgi:hypothetical protein